MSAGGLRSNMLHMQGNKGKVFGAAVTVPIPVNTPSLRMENKGKDVNVNLIPLGSAGVWGASSSSSAESTEQANAAPVSVPTTVHPSVSKPAPWATKSVQNTIDTGGDGHAGKPERQKSWADTDSDEDDDKETPASENDKKPETNHDNDWRYGRDDGPAEQDLQQVV